MGMSKHNFVISSNKTTLINQSLKIWKLLSKKRKFELQFEVLNALIKPDTHPLFRIVVRPKQ